MEAIEESVFNSYLYFLILGNLVMNDEEKEELREMYEIYIANGETCPVDLTPEQIGLLHRLSTMTLEVILSHAQALRRTIEILEK